MKKVAVFLGAAALAGGGCGGGDDDNKSADQTGAGPTRVEVIRSIGKPGAFDPSRIYKAEAAGVVTVTSIFGDAKGVGTGFVVSRNGEVATNAHVVTDGPGAGRRADEVYVQFADGNQVPAKIVGYDPNADVGVVKVNPKGLNLTPLTLGHTSAVHVGDPVAAIGSPFGEENSLSVGVVSAKNRTIDALTDFSIGDAIQTDAAINRGNSGGPLLDARGRVIGINSRIRSSGGGSVGVGFAVSVDTVRRSIDEIRANGQVRYAYIGVSSQPLYPQLARKLGLPVDDGALIADVVKGGPADKAGLRGGARQVRFQASLAKVGGDVITKINGHPITRSNDFSNQITQYKPGDRITLEVYRGSQRRTAQVTLGERPTSVQSK